jgi:hypothetical protein
MSRPFTHIQRAQNAITVFWLNLFPACTHLKIVEKMQEAITRENLVTMPKQSRLLLAHWLNRNDPEMTFLTDDTDVCYMLLADWLTSMPCSTIGASNFRFKPYIWSELTSLRAEILPGNQSVLESYRVRKSAIYPWVW